MLTDRMEKRDNVKKERGDFSRSIQINKVKTLEMEKTKRTHLVG